MDERQRHARSFGGAADAYARARPPYPGAALDFLVPPPVRAVLDLGAGTGKLTASLASRGLDVVAVEPLPEMLAELRAALPAVRALPGTAEDVPLPDACVDAVVVGQAWHWFDHERALTEAARVLRPGGRLSLAWNLRDERRDWVARLGEALHSAGDRENPRTAEAVRAPFGPVERLEVPWEHHVTPEALLDLVRSRSYVIVLPEARRAEVLGAVEELLRTHPDLRGLATISLPYVTVCFRARLGS